ncbi:MAG: hypothetical protein K2N81_07210, partial [Acetatifactor sp.]|nr:hypothetical protein [Acetatifactor sp.]
MFKQRNMTRKLKQRLGRAISIVMSAAMIVTALPADLLGGIASVSAAPDAGTATVLNVSDMTKGSVPKGAMNGSVFSAKDNSMSVVEDAQSFDGEDYTQSLKLTETSAITFDAAKGDTLTVYAMADKGQDTDKAATKLTVTGEEGGSGDEKAKDTKEMALTEVLASKEMALAVDGSYTLTVNGTAKVFYLELKSAGSGSDVEKQTKTYVWDTTKEPTDGTIANGAKLGDEKYFKAVMREVVITDSEGKDTTVKGSFTKKTGGTPTAVVAVEISKAGSSSVDFTVKGTASVTIEAGSTSGSNQSVIALKGVDGYVTPTKTELASTSAGTKGSVKDDGSVVVSNTKGNTIVYENLPAGTYSILSPNDANYGRGTRVIKVTVDDTVELVKEAKTFAWDTTKEPTDGTIVNGAKLGDEKYFKAVMREVVITDSEGKDTTVKGSFTKKTGGTPTAVVAVEISKAGSSSVDFTVKGTASVTIEAGSTSGSNQSVIALKGVDGYVTPTKTELASTSAGTKGSVKDDGSVVVSNTKGNTIVYENLPAGTYSILSPNDADYGRGTRVIKVTVVDTALWGEDTLLAWKDVAAPEIVSAKVSAKDKGTIEVQANGQVGNGAADSMKVVMFDKDGKEVDSQETLVDDDVHTLEFQPTATGSYTFVAHLVREDEEDKVSASSAAVAFVLPMATPVIQGVSNTGVNAEGKGGLTIVWDEVPEAEKYKVTIVDAKDATKVLASGET